jgi:hypothetical protein
MWRYVAWHLDGHGIRSVLVGGAVVAIYTEGLYRSGDLDMITDGLDRHRLPEALAEIGFQPGKSRYFKHPECPHLFLEFPHGPVEIGDEHPITPDEIQVEGRILRLLSPTDCVKDRLASYIHWQSFDCFEQALLVCHRQAERVDLESISAWCRKEGASDVFASLTARLGIASSAFDPEPKPPA